MQLITPDQFTLQQQSAISKLFDNARFIACQDFDCDLNFSDNVFTLTDDDEDEYFYILQGVIENSENSLFETHVFVVQTEKGELLPITTGAMLASSMSEI